MNTQIILFILAILSVAGCYRERIHVIASDTMKPTFVVGDRIEYSFTNRTFSRSDIIIVKGKVFYPDNDYIFPLRIVGLPGETVKCIEDELCVIKDSEIIYRTRFVDIKSLPSVRFEILSRNLTLPIIDFTKGYKIPNDHYFLLGDNVEVAIDSRVFGAVAEELILGKAKKSGD